MRGFVKAALVWAKFLKEMEKPRVADDGVCYINERDSLKACKLAMASTK